MTVDWLESKLIHRFEYEMIDAVNINYSYGFLNGVVNAESNLEYGYDTVTRVTGKLSLVDSNYIEGCRIRIHHYIDEYDYHVLLGTFFCGTSTMTLKNGVWSGTIDLYSALFGLHEDYLTWNYILPKGSTVYQAIERLLTDTVRPYKLLTDINNYTYTDNVIYEQNDNVLECLEDIVTSTTDGSINGRLDVDAEGYVTIRKYQKPNTLPSKVVWDYDSAQSSIVSGLKQVNNRLDVPGRVGLLYNNGSVNIAASAPAPTSSYAHPSRRGYTKVVQKTVNDMVPETYSQAQTLANKYILEQSVENITYEFETTYYPILPGDGATLIVLGQIMHVLVTDVSYSLKPGLVMNVIVKKT